VTGSRRPAAGTRPGALRLAAVDRSIVGKPAGRSRVVVERGPVANFAKAVHDGDPAYSDPQAAAAAGLPGIPAPPTFPFAMEHWGRFAEDQPRRDGLVDAIAEVLGPPLGQGGVILHGEQSFEYERPVVVGDVLDGETTVVDVYEKESKGRRMTFLVLETVWSEPSTGARVVTSRMNLIHRS
jgi:acyl dehydratase